METANPNSTAQPSASGTEYFTFTGTGGEYFRIWIVNLLLSIVTLGIYSAWAKVRRLRYFYGSTVLGGSTFEYHGDPIKILKGRLIAMALILPYSFFGETSPILAALFGLIFLIALPFIVVKSRLFQTRMSSWRNIRFNFVGTYWRAARVYIGTALLIVPTLGLIIPYYIFTRQRFLLEEAKFGTAQVRFGAMPGRYYVTFLVALAIVVGGLILAALLAVIFGAGIGYVLLGGEEGPSGVAAPVARVFAFVGLLAAYFLAYAYVQANITNAAYGELEIGNHQLKSDLTTMPLAGIYFTNALFIGLTLGLYTPWAKVRLARYQIENMRLHTQGSLDEFVAAETQAVEATGGEIGDLLDLDFGL